MLDYPTFCYLQNHKTGCTFVEAFLRQFCVEPLLAYKKHAALEKAPGKFCFTNVREPLALYRSLYAYGLDGKGTVFLRLNRLGHGDLYAQRLDGFAQWLAFVIKPQHAPLLSDAYTPTVARFVGFMTWRFLRLACPGFEQTAPNLADRAALLDFIRKQYILNAVLRQETLNVDLGKIVRSKLAACFSDPPAAVAWLDAAPKINASQTDASAAQAPDELIRRVLRKEIILYQSFYPAIMRQKIAAFRTLNKLADPL